MNFWENIVYLSSCKFKMTIKLSMLVIDTSQSCLWENWVLLSGWPNYDLTSAYNFRSNSFSSTSITLFIFQLSFVSPFLEFYDHPWSGPVLFSSPTSFQSELLLEFVQILQFKIWLLTANFLHYFSLCSATIRRRLN